MAHLNKQQQYEECRDNYLRTLIQDIIHKGGDRILTRYLIKLNEIMNLGIKTKHPETLKKKICEKTIKNPHLHCSRCKTIGHFYGQQGCDRFKEHICQKCQTKGHWEKICNNCTKCGFWGPNHNAANSANCVRTRHRNGRELV